MKLAVFFTFLIFGTSATIIPEPDPCDNLKVEAVVTHTTDGLDNGSVEVKVDNYVGKIYYFYHNSTGFPISTDGDKKKLYDLKKGDYSCTVVTDDGCNKKVKFIIE